MICLVVWLNGVVPFPVPCIWFQIDISQLLVRNPLPGGINPLVQAAVDLQSCLGLGGGNQLHDDLVGHQRLAPPILSDEGEESMLYLVPFASAWRQVAHSDGESEVVSQRLELEFPQPKPVPIAATRVCHYQQVGSVGIESLSQLSVPRAYGLNSELSRVMANAYTDPGFILCKVINAIGYRFAHLLIREVVGVDWFWLSLETQFPSCVLVVTHQLFFLCIHGDGWVSRFQLTAYRLIDMLELGISVWMLRAFQTFFVPLKTVTQVLKQFGKGMLAQRVALLLHCRHQIALAPCSPQQRGFRVATGGGLQQFLERGQQLGMFLRQFLPATTRNSTAMRFQNWRNTRLYLLAFLQAAKDCLMRQAGGTTGSRDATVAKRQRFTTGKQATATLSEGALEALKAFSDFGFSGFALCHGLGIEIHAMAPQITSSSKSKDSGSTSYDTTL